MLETFHNLFYDWELIIVGKIVPSYKFLSFLLLKVFPASMQFFPCLLNASGW